MEHISKSLNVFRQNIEIVNADPVTRHGFTQVPNFILTEPNLSVGAKLTYAMLLRYAWQNDYCFPGQDRMAEDMGVGKRSVVRFMSELEESGFVEVRRRGLGQTNLYRLHMLVTNPKKGKRVVSRSAKLALQEVPNVRIQ